MEVGDHHHVAAGIGETVEDDQIVRAAVNHQPRMVIIRPGGAAEDALAGIPGGGHVLIAPGGPKIIHAEPRGNDYGAGVSGGGATGAAGVAELLTTSFNSLLGLKYGIFLAGTSTRAPVLGLRAIRGWLGSRARAAGRSTRFISFWPSTSASVSFFGLTAAFRATTVSTRRDGGVGSPGRPTNPEPWPAEEYSTPFTVTGLALSGERLM